MPALPPLIHDKSRMRRRACTDPCGGRSAMVVPTATVRAEQRVVQEGSSPSGAQMRGAISKKRGSQPRWPEEVEGMETSKRARRRKLDTAKTDLKPPLAVLRRAGCPSRGGIRRACGEVPGRNRWGNSQDEPVGPRWGKVESALLRRRRPHHLPRNIGIVSMILFIRWEKSSAVMD